MFFTERRFLSGGCEAVIIWVDATGTNPLLKVVFFGGGQNIKKREVFAAARLDVGPFFFYLVIIFSLIF